jgi:inhibitor of KinA
VSPAPRLLALGDSAWTVEFGDAIVPALNARVMQLDARVRAGLAAGEPALAGVWDRVPTFRSLTVHFDPWATDADALGAQLLAWAGSAGASEAPGRHWRLPLCADHDFAPDLSAVAERHGLAPAAVLHQLLASRFRVYMIGFMPGFPYMGGWPAALATPRLASPRKRVPPHSVAVAGTMCGVYPWPSPGGWNILGRTPVTLFDPLHRTAPAWLAAGDQVDWQAVDRDGYERIQAELARRQRQREDFLATPEPG